MSTTRVRLSRLHQSDHSFFVLEENEGPLRRLLCPKKTFWPSPKQHAHFVRRLVTFTGRKQQPACVIRNKSFAWKDGVAGLHCLLAIGEKSWWVNSWCRQGSRENALRCTEMFARNAWNDVGWVTMAISSKQTVTFGVKINRIQG